MRSTRGSTRTERLNFKNLTAGEQEHWKKQEEWVMERIDQWLWEEPMPGNSVLVVPVDPYHPQFSLEAEECIDCPAVLMRRFYRRIWKAVDENRYYVAVEAPLLHTVYLWGPHTPW